MIRTTAASALVGLGLIAASTGMGHASATPLPGPVPTFTFTSHLESLLVAPRELTRISGSEQAMRAVVTMTDLAEGSTGLTPAECAGAFEPARRSAYTDSGWTGVSTQVVTDDKPGQARHLVTQAIIGFTELDAALKQVNAAAKTWARCGGRTVSYTTSSSDARRWRLGEAELRRGKTVLAQVQTGRAGTCERAMTAASLAGGTAVIADVMACDFGGGDPNGQAEAITGSIRTNAGRAQ